MSTSTETISPDLCRHLAADGHLDQPFALLAPASPQDQPQYLCPACLSAQIETRLIDGTTPAQIVGQVSFTNCGHVPASGFCHVCHAATVAALTGSWAALHLLGEVETAEQLKATIAAIKRDGEMIRLPGNRWTPRLPHVSLRVKLAKDEKAGRTRPAIKSTPAWPVVVVSRPQAAVA